MPILPAGRSVWFGEKTFNFSSATSALELIRGLSGVATLGSFDGMCFDFGYEMDVAMTPRGLLFPVELAFVKEDGTITQITILNPSFGHNSYSDEKVRYALEVPIGFFEKNNIDVGHKLEL